MRIGILVMALGLATACAPKEEPAAPVVEAPKPAEAAPDPTSLPTPVPDQRVGTIAMMCGGQAMRVAFEDTRAVVVNDDGSNIELAKLDGQPGAAADMTTYTNGKMTFLRKGAGDTAEIKYAAGKAALQDCTRNQDQTK